MTRAVSLRDRVGHRVGWTTTWPRAVDRLFVLGGFLARIGWARSAAEQRPCDVDGEALPWFSYAAISLLAQHEWRGCRVVEYGTGNSTLWWSSRGASVIGIEHDRRWHADVVRMCAGRDVEVRLHDDEASYAEAASIDELSRADVIVVDGAARNACIARAAQHAPAHALVVLDNADYLHLHEAHACMHDAGFLRVDLSGPTPGGVAFTCTSLFTRDAGRWLRPERPPRAWGVSISNYSDDNLRAPTIDGR